MTYSSLGHSEDPAAFCFSFRSGWLRPGLRPERYTWLAEIEIQHPHHLAFM